MSIETRRLGASDLELTVVGLGTWQFGGRWGGADAPLVKLEMQLLAVIAADPLMRIAAATPQTVTPVHNGAWAAGGARTIRWREQT